MPHISIPENQKSKKKIFSSSISIRSSKKQPNKKKKYNPKKISRNFTFCFVNLNTGAKATANQMKMQPQCPRIAANKKNLYS